MVTLRYKVGVALAVGDDWPDPNDTPTQVAPDPKMVSAVMVPNVAQGERRIDDAGQPVTETVQGFFYAVEDLNDVESVTWQGAEFHILAATAYELQGEVLAQQATLVRRAATVARAHG